MKQAVRVEHTDGWGMFQDYTYTEDAGAPMAESFREHSLYGLGLHEASSRHRNFKNPDDDGLSITREHFCAYKSIEDLRRWIREHELVKLLENNYTVYLLELSEYQEGKFNILFKKKHIVSLKDISNQIYLNYEQAI